jgi:hypothetical protein
VQLQDSLPDLQKRGLGLAAISYDSTETLKAFAERRGITFPLLSDAGSATIKSYGLLNIEATGRMAGIPHPGTFIIDARGTVVSRSFEAQYQERATAGNLTARAGAGPRDSRQIETPHLTITTGASDGSVAPGSRFSLVIDIAPKPRMHVYAPQQTDYIPISLTLESDDAIKPHPPTFPAPERFFFKPLKETQLVYSRRFRIVQDLTVALTPAVRERAKAEDAALKINGVLRYQACDDMICYVPKDVPVSWVVRLKGLER